MKYKYLGIIIFLSIWMFFSYARISNPIFIPEPHLTFYKFITLFGDVNFYYDLLNTLYRVIIGILLSAIIGIPLGLILGSNKKIYASSELLLDFLRSIPATALFPLALLIFGIGDLAKIGIVTFSCSLILILQTYYGVMNKSKIRTNTLKILQASKGDVFKHLLVWEALPYIFAGLRVTVSLSLILVIVTEMFIGTDYGLGKRLIDAQSTYRITELYSVIIIIGILGYYLNQMTLLVERRLIHWKN